MKLKTENFRFGSTDGTKADAPLSLGINFRIVP